MQPLTVMGNGDVSARRFKAINQSLQQLAGQSRRITRHGQHIWRRGGTHQTQESRERPIETIIGILNYRESQRFIGFKVAVGVNQPRPSHLAQRVQGIADQRSDAKR